MKAKMDTFLRHDGCYVDVGSGSGHMVERVLSSGVDNCAGVDPYWRPILQVRRRLLKNAPDRYQFPRVQGQTLPFLDTSVDGIFFCFVLHHVHYDVQDQLIRESRRVLKKDGVLVVFEDTPNDTKEWRRVERWDRIQNFEPPWERHFYRSVMEWKTYFGKMGLRIVYDYEFDKMIPQMGMSSVPHYVTVLR